MSTTYHFMNIAMAGHLKRALKKGRNKATMEEGEGSGSGSRKKATMEEGEGSGSRKKAKMEEEEDEDSRMKDKAKMVEDYDIAGGSGVSAEGASAGQVFGQPLGAVRETITRAGLGQSERQSLIESLQSLGPLGPVFEMSLGVTIAQSLAPQSIDPTKHKSLRQSRGQSLAPQSINPNVATYNRSSTAELSNTSFGKWVRSNFLGSYDDSVLPNPLSAQEADGVLKKWAKPIEKRMNQKDFRNWMSKINKDACSLEVRFTGDDCEPDIGSKKCDFSLVIKGSTTVDVDTVAVFGLQSSPTGSYKSDKEIGEAIRRAQYVIAGSGLGRQYCIAGCTNGILVQWILVVGDTTDFSYVRCPEYSFRESLCAFLTSKLSALYYNKLEPTDVDGKQLVFNRILGFGATSKVYSCQYDGQTVVAKLYNDSLDADYEANILEKLRGVSNIPTVVARGRGILLMEKVGEALSKSMLEQEYAGKFCNIVEDALQEAHDLGIVHRDVRIPNMLKVKQEGQACMMLIDWGFAATSYTPFPFVGSYVTASDSLLDQLEREIMPLPSKMMRATRSASSVPKPWNERPSSPLVIVEPKDDLISLVRSFYLYVKRGTSYQGRLGDYKGIKRFWEKEFATNKAFGFGQEFATARKYNELKLWLGEWADFSVTG